MARRIDKIDVSYLIKNFEGDRSDWKKNSHMYDITAKSCVGLFKMHSIRFVETGWEIKKVLVEKGLAFSRQKSIGKEGETIAKMLTDSIISLFCIDLTCTHVSSVKEVWHSDWQGR